MWKYIVVIQNALRWLYCHQLASLNVNGQLDLRLAAKRYRLCLYQRCHIYRSTLPLITSTEKMVKRIQESEKKTENKMATLKFATDKLLVE